MTRRNYSKTNKSFNETHRLAIHHLKKPDKTVTGMVLLRPQIVHKDLRATDRALVTEPRQEAARKHR